MKIMYAKKRDSEEIFISREEWNELYRQGLIDGGDAEEIHVLGLTMRVAEETDGYVGPPSYDWERGV